MSSLAYYNELDPYAAQWLRNLIAAGHIAPGDVDERSIEDVRPDELRGYAQCHFFAGIGVWSHALRLAGWPDDRPVWTGSCPCQPFSAAGKGAGFDDERHLWPAWFHLIRERRPPVVFGEQVAAGIRHGWIDLVRADLENEGYACGHSVFGAHSVGAPHIRQRMFFVADADTTGQHELGRSELFDGERPPQRDDADGRGAICKLAESAREQFDGGRDARRGGRELADGCGMGNAHDARLEGRQLSGERAGERVARSAGLAGDGVEHASGIGRQRREATASGYVYDWQASERTQGEHGPRIAGSHWSGCDWIPCRDGKLRPVEPGTFPLAHGATARVGRLRAYGNAIVAPAAEAFVRAYAEAVA